MRLATPRGWGPVTYDLRIARKDYGCDMSYPHSGGREIRKGDRYIVCTEYPGGDSGFADAAKQPVRLRICLDCLSPQMRKQVPDEPR